MIVLLPICIYSGTSFL